MSGSGDSRYYSKTFIREFIELYKSHPCLWKAGCKELYQNRRLKEIAYAELTEKLKEVENDANKDMVCRKLHGLRSSFRREYRKVEDSKRSGSDAPYETRLWYYDLMLFTADHENQNISLDIDYQQNNEDDEEEFQYNIDGDDCTGVFTKAANIRDYCDSAMIIERPSDGEGIGPVPRIVNLPDKKRKRRELNFDHNQSSQPNLEEEFLSAITPVTPQIPPRDDFDTFGAFVASELRQLRSEEIRKKLKKTITKAIVEAWECE